jgi:hypothetical protein
VEWSGVEWSGVEWSGVEWSGVEWSPVPDTRSHRGPDPHDAWAFHPDALPALRSATTELSWLFDRGYMPTASLELVGNRWMLTERQRRAVLRSACADGALSARVCRRIEPEELAGQALALDGFNVLTTLEAALGGAVVLIGRDGCLRDIAGVHGTYRKVEETVPAARVLGELLVEWEVGPCTWLLDSPVSNSGRLRAALLEAAHERGWDWRVELVTNPDALLTNSLDVVATADSVILDRCRRWLNLARLAVVDRVPGAFLVDLSG